MPPTPGRPVREVGPFASDDPVWALTRDRWSARLAMLAPEAVLAPLADEDLLALAPPDPMLGAVRDPGLGWTPSPAARGALEDALATWPHGVFAKLGPFSLKSPDRSAARTRIMTIGDALRMLSPPPGRVARAAGAALRHGLAMEIVLTPWIEIAPWTEFRMFFRGGAFAGVTQADARMAYPEISERRDDIGMALGGLARQMLEAGLPLPDCAADVALGPGNANSALTAWLVEVNPLDHRLDLGLFREAGIAGLDGGFRFYS